MAFTVECPECAKSLRVSDEKANSMVKCPQCGAKFRATDDSSDSSDGDDHLARPNRSRKGTKSKSSTFGGLQPFLHRWLMVCAISSALIVVVALGGLFSEILAISASLMCVAAILVCSLVGSIWMAVDLGKESIALALSSVVMPPVGLVTAFQNRSPARRGAIVFASMLVPTILLGLMLLVFYPKYAAPRQRGAQSNNWENLIHQMDNQMTAETPVVTAKLTVAARPGSLDGLQPQCEVLLQQFKSYVTGSLKIDVAARTITYQYRGSDKFESLLAFYLGSKTGAFIPQINIKSTEPSPPVQTDGKPSGP